VNFTAQNIGDSRYLIDSANHSAAPLDYPREISGGNPLSLHF